MADKTVSYRSMTADWSALLPIAWPQRISHRKIAHAIATLTGVCTGCVTLYEQAQLVRRDSRTRCVSVTAGAGGAVLDDWYCRQIGPLWRANRIDCRLSGRATARLYRHAPVNMSRPDGWR
jgi:hypothetical protein